MKSEDSADSLEDLVELGHLAIASETAHMQRHLEEVCALGQQLSFEIDDVGWTSSEFSRSLEIRMTRQLRNGRAGDYQGPSMASYRDGSLSLRRPDRDRP